MDSVIQESVLCLMIMSDYSQLIYILISYVVIESNNFISS